MRNPNLFSNMAGGDGGAFRSHRFPWHLGADLSHLPRTGESDPSESGEHRKKITISHDSVDADFNAGGPGTWSRIVDEDFSTYRKETITSAMWESRLVLVSMS